MESAGGSAQLGWRANPPDKGVAMPCTSLALLPGVCTSLQHDDPKRSDDDTVDPSLRGEGWRRGPRVLPCGDSGSREPGGGLVRERWAAQAGQLTSSRAGPPETL